MNIAEITPRQDFSLLVRTETGQTGCFDVRPYLEFDAFRPLQNLAEFFNVRNGRYFVEWPCGADLSADTLFARWQSPPALPGRCGDSELMKASP